MYKNSHYLLGTTGTENYQPCFSLLIDFPAKLLTRDDPGRTEALAHAAPIQSA